MAPKEAREVRYGARLRLSSALQARRLAPTKQEDPLWSFHRRDRGSSQRCQR